jgi:hypothetical protein
MIAVEHPILVAIERTCLKEPQSSKDAVNPAGFRRTEWIDDPALSILKSNASCRSVGSRCSPA